MKITDNGNFCTIELETDSGIANYASSLKSDNPRDFRSWTRDSETLEMGQYIQQNNKHSQVVVKCGNNYTRIR